MITDDEVRCFTYSNTLCCSLADLILNEQYVKRNNFRLYEVGQQMAPFFIPYSFYTFYIF